MNKVFSHMTMSLDGYIADPHDGIDELFEWYDAGDVSLPSANDDISFNVDDDGSEMLNEITSTTGALVSGRRLFDITNGWGGNHPIGAPVVVVTHHAPEDAEAWKSTTFSSSVEEGISRARQIAADKNVVISSPNIISQALDLGLLDEVHVSLVPVLLGEGIAHFGNLTGAPHRLEDPIIRPGTRATHLQYTVRKG